MEARALPIEEERAFLSTSFLNYTSFLKFPLVVSQERLNSQEKLVFQAFLTQVNGNGNGNGKIKVESDVGVNGKANGGVLSVRDWEEMWEYVVSSRFVRDEIKRRHGYISGIGVEDLVKDAYVVGMEELKLCREKNCCVGCVGCGCETWEKKFRIAFRKALKRLQDLEKRNGRVSYLELVEEEEGVEKLPTTYRRDWDMSANLALDPLMQLCAKEEEKERVNGKDERMKKVREALKKLKKREREVWELLLSGMSPQEVAKALGYRKVQGIYMVIRRSVRRLKKFVREC
jgi:RNA polymerase sigma factor (sigma-70 family)